MAKYLLLRSRLVLLKTSARCGTPIFLKVNHQLAGYRLVYGRAADFPLGCPVS
jgi:hypothetical protein